MSINFHTSTKQPRIYEFFPEIRQLKTNFSDFFKSKYFFRKFSRHFQANGKLSFHKLIKFQYRKRSFLENCIFHFSQNFLFTLIIFSIHFWFSIDVEEEKIQFHLIAETELCGILTKLPSDTSLKFQRFFLPNTKKHLVFVSQWLIVPRSGYFIQNTNKKGTKNVIS